MTKQRLVANPAIHYHFDEATGVRTTKVVGGDLVAESEDPAALEVAGKLHLFDRPQAHLVVAEGEAFVRDFRWVAGEARIAEVRALLEGAERRAWMAGSHCVLLLTFIVADWLAGFGVAGYLSVPVVNGLYQLLSRIGDANEVEALWVAMMINILWLVFAAYL